MKLPYLILTLILLPVLVASKTLHDYYVSVTVVEYSKEDKSLQIISQIFIDDLEELIRARYDESITLEAADEPVMVDDYIQKYLKNKVLVNVNGEQKNINFLGKEYVDDIAYCYLEVLDVKHISSIEMTNKILFDILPQQQNIVRFKLKNKNKSFLLINGNEKCLLNFD